MEDAPVGDRELQATTDIYLSTRTTAMAIQVNPDGFGAIRIACTETT